MLFRYLPEGFGGCGMASDAVGAVKLEIPWGFKLLKFKTAEYFRIIFTLTILKILKRSV
jgi:hypothetical protein